jgi:hypothetical protein
MKTRSNHRSEQEVRDHVHRKDDGNAFFPDPEGGEAHAGNDTLAENLAEVFLESATSGEERAEEALNELVTEELGGPFLEDAPDDDDLPIEPLPPPRDRRRVAKPN